MYWQLHMPTLAVVFRVFSDSVQLKKEPFPYLGTSQHVVFPGVVSANLARGGSATSREACFRLHLYSSGAKVQATHKSTFNALLQRQLRVVHYHIHVLGERVSALLIDLDISLSCTCYLIYYFRRATCAVVLSLLTGLHLRLLHQSHDLVYSAKPCSNSVLRPRGLPNSDARSGTDNVTLHDCKSWETLHCCQSSEYRSKSRPTCIHGSCDNIFEYDCVDISEFCHRHTTRSIHSTGDHLLPMNCRSHDSQFWCCGFQRLFSTSFACFVVLE